MKRIFIVMGMVAVLSVVGASVYSNKDTPAPVAQHATAVVERGSLSSTVSATGTINPLTTVTIGSQVSGRLDRIAVDFNSRVKKGDVIAQIDPSLFRTQVAQAEATVKSAQASVEKADVHLREAQRQIQRLTELRNKKLVAESEVDTARFAQEAAIADKHMQEGQLAQSRAALEQARVNLANTTITAPIDGVVVSRSVDVGQTVAASLQSPTLFTIAKDLAQMQIETQVDEAFIGQIRDRQQVAFTVFAYPGREFTGTVAQVRLNPIVESGVVKYNCIISVDNHDLALKPGMTATATIEVQRRDNILKAPSSALRFVPDWSAEKLTALREGIKRDQAVVWVVEQADVKPITVNVGLTGEKHTEISGEGLQEGMHVAVPGARAENKAPSGPPRGLRVF